jgi:hypothetical protein
MSPQRAIPASTSLRVSARAGSVSGIANNAKIDT